MEWVPESADELVSAAEGAEGGSRARAVATAIRHATAGRDTFSILVAELLTEFRDGRYWGQLGHASFGAFVRAELSLGLRAAQQMIRIYRRLVVELGVPPDRLRRLGWSKLAVVAAAITPANVHAVLADVAAMSFADLRARYAPPAPAPAQAPALAVTPIVAAALSRAALTPGHGDPQAALELVCRTYLALSAASTSGA